MASTDEEKIASSLRWPCIEERRSASSAACEQTNRPHSRGVSSQSTNGTKKASRHID
jgi:hypothetical protein